MTRFRSGSFRCRRGCGRPFGRMPKGLVYPTCQNMCFQRTIKSRRCRCGGFCCRKMVCGCWCRRGNFLPLLRRFHRRHRLQSCRNRTLSVYPRFRNCCAPRCPESLRFPVRSPFGSHRYCLHPWSRFRYGFPFPCHAQRRQAYLCRFCRMHHCSLPDCFPCFFRSYSRW